MWSSFRDVGRYVEGIWSFLVGPVLETLILIQIVLFVCGPARLVHGLREPLPSLDQLTSQRLEHFLKFYGINTLMPIFILVLLVLFFFSVNRLMWLGTNFLPPKFTFQKEKLLARATLSDVAAVWSAFPKAKEITDLDYVINEQLRKAEQEGASFYSDVAWYQKRYSNLHKLMALAKTYFFWSIGVAAVAVYYGVPRDVAVPRAVVVSVVCVFVFAYALMSLVHVMEQMQYSRFRVMRALIATGDIVPAPDGEERTEREARAFLGGAPGGPGPADVGGRWWSLRVYLPLPIERGMRQFSMRRRLKRLHRRGVAD